MCTGSKPQPAPTPAPAPPPPIEPPKAPEFNEENTSGQVAAGKRGRGSFRIDRIFSNSLGGGGAGLNIPV